MRYVSATRIEIWALDPLTGARARLLPTAATPENVAVAYGELAFSRNPDVLFVTTDRDGEFQRAARVDLASGRHDYFGPANWDVETLDVSPDGRTIATVTNEAGVGVLRLWDADTLAEKSRPAVPIGAVSRLAWHHDSRHLGFNLNSARSPGDVYALDTTTGTVSRWTESKVEGLDPATFAVQQPIRWTSFDGREITGFIARPPARFTGRRPVMIQIHGGPEGQARPGFLGRWNYYVNELGVAIIEPNVRGSSGYGKTFISLDDGMKREDSVKDIGALLDWIATQPDLDPARVVVAGGSYGGYMSLAVAATYPERIAGAIDVVGIANFVSFL
jgi:dipeptidyl aminopeptidase/acylaminoacyl peptidase